MNTRLLSSSVLAYAVFVACVLIYPLKVGAQTQYPTDPNDAILKSRIPTSTIPQSSLDFTRVKGNTGNVSVPIPLVSLGGANVQLEYYSQGVANKVRTENQYAPSGPVGLGWQLLYGSISAEINGSADTSDDRYYYNGPDGSFQLQEGADGVFRIPNYRPWKIQRIMSGSAVVGWTVTKEDGTILRFGNYDKSTGQFCLQYSPTYATRFFLGYDDLVVNPDSSLYDSLSYIPYQWDLSNVQDMEGNQTTLSYQQVEFPLRTGDHSSDSEYTRESHLSQILDNKGQEVDFSYAPMDSNEYYDSLATFDQNLVDTLYLNHITFRGNGQVYKKIVLQYNSGDILGIGVVKRYLVELSIEDSIGDSLPSYNFGYYGLSGVPAGVNPGVLASVSDPDGGQVSYSYRMQSVPNVQLSKKDTVSLINYWGLFGNNYATIEGGLAGRDFVCVSKNLSAGSDSVRVYRRGAAGWYSDTSCPIKYRWQAAAGNDFIAAQGGMVARLTRDGWDSSNVASKTATDCAIIGVGPNYYVVRYNEQNYYWNIAVVMLTPVGTKVDTLPGTYWDLGEPFIDGSTAPATRAYCGQDYFVLIGYNENTSYAYFSHFRFSKAAKGWTMSLNRGDSTLGASRDNIPFAKVGKNFVVCGYDWPWDGTQGGVATVKVYHHYGAHVDSVDQVTYDIGTGSTSLELGDDYYAYAYETTNPTRYLATVRTWDGTKFNSTTFSPSDGYPGINLSSLGNKLILSWPDSASHNGELGYTVFNPGTQAWNPLVQLDSTPNSNANWFWVPSGVSLDNETVAELWKMETYVDGGGLVGSQPPQAPFIRAYQFRGDTVVTTDVASLPLRSNEDPTHWIFQPGNSFLALSRSSQGTSASGPDSLQIFTFNQCADGTMQFNGIDSATVVYQRTESGGMGQNAMYSYSFQNGVVNQYYTPEFGTVTESLPGSNGSIVTSYYTCKDSVVGDTLNYKDLEGMSYDEKEYNNQNTIVHETQNTWTAVGVDSINGVFDAELKSKTEYADGVPKTTSYSYEDSAHAFQLSQIVETNSDSTQRITRMLYPEDYTVSSPQDMMTEALDSMQVRNDISPVVEKWVIQNKGGTQTVVASDLTEYSIPHPGEILPSQKLRLRSASPLAVGDFVSSHCANGYFSADPNYVSEKVFTSYTPYGQIVEEMDPDGNYSTTKWGYDYEEPVAQIQNARDSETLTADFEDGMDNLSYGGSPGEAYMDTSSLYAYTGLRSFEITQQEGGTTYLYTPNQLSVSPGKTYSVSAMVMGQNVGSNVLSYKVDFYTSSGTLLADSTENATGMTGTFSWTPLVYTFAVPDSAAAMDVYLQVTGDPYSAALFFDNIRIAPQNALVATTTYDPATLEITCKTGPDGNPTYYAYDSFQRPVSKQNYTHSAVNRQSYYLAGSSISATNPDYTTTVLYRSSADSTTTAAYTDGLGRKIETRTQTGASDIVSSVTYDSLGRQSVVYKLFQDTTGHTFDPLTGINSKVCNYYNWNLGIGDDAPFSVYDYYDTHRLKDMKPEGSAWQNGHYVTYSYGSNSASEVGNYPANTFNKTTITDENGVKRLEFRDNFGNLVQTVTDSATSRLVDSSEYDVMGNLVRSIPPNGISYATMYSYDTRGELTQKTSPDAGTVLYLYDRNGNLRFIKDANHNGGSANSEFIYRKYDDLNRLTEEGEYGSASSSGDFTQQNADSTSFPTSNYVASKKFYFDVPSSDTVAVGQRNLKGRLSWSESYRLGVLVSRTYYSYDGMGRVEWMVQDNFIGRPVKLTYKYDLQGNIVERGYVEL